MTPASTNIYFSRPEAVEIRSEPLPDLRPDQVLIQAEKSLISTGTELTCYSGRFAPGTHWDDWVKYPFKPGYSMVGRIVQVGAEVAGDWQVGQRVAASAPHHQHNAVAPRRLHPVPAGVSAAEASWFHINIITQQAVRLAEIRLGDAVAVVGLGILGQLVCQLVRLAGATTVMAVDPSGPRVNTAVELGATHGLAMTAAAAEERVAELTDGRGADVVFDVTGVAPVFSQAQGLARRFGTVVLLGDSGYPEQQHLTRHVIRRGLRLVGSHDGHAPRQAQQHNRWTRAAMTRFFFELVAAGRVEVAALSGAEVSPLDAAGVYEQLLASREQHLGVVFDWCRI